MEAEAKSIKFGRYKSLFDYFVFLILLLMVVLVFINAFMRYVFNSGFPISEELARYFFIWTSFLGAVVAFKEGKHVGVTLLVDKLKGVSQILVKTVADILVIFAMWIVFIGGLNYMKVAAATKSPATGIPFGYIAVSIIVTAVLIITIVIIEMYKRFKDLKIGRK